MTHDHGRSGHDAASHEHAQSPDAARVDCDAALERLFDFLDGELDASFEQRLKAHVGHCKKCFERADFERRFLEAVQSARGEQQCPNALRERVIATLRAEGLEA
jgi:anti-sigma factor (TIGR02949 family)